jgi:hypothetical protein
MRFQKELTFSPPDGGLEKETMVDTMVDAKEIRTLILGLQLEASKLNQNADLVNRLLRSAEDQINIAAPGIELWLDDDIDPTDADYEEDDSGAAVSSFAYRFGYSRLDQGWGLAAKKVVQCDPDGRRITLPWHRIEISPQTYDVNGPKVVPIASAPLSMRIQSLELLPALIRSLTEAVKKRNQTIERAASLTGDSSTDEPAEGEHRQR